jgi:hypothetical protein
VDCGFVLQFGVCGAQELIVSSWSPSMLFARKEYGGCFMVCFMVSCFGVLEESVAVWCNLCVSVTKCDVCVWRPIDSVW